MNIMKYDFDSVIDRHNTCSMKYDSDIKLGSSTTPMWVADMDFRSPPAVCEAVRKSAEFGIFGYCQPDDEYYNAVIGWYAKHFDWKIEKEWIVVTQGVVAALAAAVEAFTERGDKIMIQRPVYYPFTNVIEQNGRNVVNSSLILSDGIYRMDFDDIERKIRSEKVKMFFLCSPHNPVGRVWSICELKKIAEICLRNNVILVSDEIHSDFVFEGRHFPMMNVDEKVKNILVTCTAPSKTFNLAGLQTSNIIISNPSLRSKFKNVLNRTSHKLLNCMGITALKAAYLQSEPWLNELKIYLAENIRIFKDYLEKNMPLLHLIAPQGTYLLWVDCRELRMTASELDKFMKEKAKLWLDGGEMFGTEGEGFERFNIACPRSVLLKALEDLKSAYDEVAYD